MKQVISTAKAIATNRYAFLHTGNWKFQGATINHAKWRKEAQQVELILDVLEARRIGIEHTAVVDANALVSCPAPKAPASFVVENYTGFTFAESR